jgi:hypothetical protein
MGAGERAGNQSESEGEMKAFWIMFLSVVLFLVGHVTGVKEGKVIAHEQWLSALKITSTNLVITSNAGK